MAAAFAPSSEGRSSELQILRREAPLHPATGCVLGVAVFSLFWLVIGFACYLAN